MYYKQGLNQCLGKASQQPAVALCKHHVIFVFLPPPAGLLENSTMEYSSKSVGSNFIFNSEEHSLQPLRSGTYFLYLYLNVSCPNICKAGLLTVQVGNKLSCQVELPEVADSTPVNKKCWAVSKIEKEDILFTQITSSEERPVSWQLSSNGLGFGIFLVD